jgi:thioredoxin reductase
VRSADPVQEWPAVVVGAGPAGLVAAATLARNGVRSLLAVPQDHLEPVLLRHLAAAGLAEVRFGASWSASTRTPTVPTRGCGPSSASAWTGQTTSPSS